MKDCYPSKGCSVPTEWFATMYHDDIQPEDLETATALAVYSDEEKCARRPKHGPW
jgi:hypothetical protein